MSSPAFESLSALAARLNAGSISSRELTSLYLDRIERADKTLKSYVRVDRDSALKLAEAADARRASGYTLGPLDGLPIAIKDLCDIEGQITTAGSQAWIARRSPVTATVVEKLLAAGMVLLGKTHMVEFAFGGYGLNPVMGTPHNPWDLKVARIPGGSSSGSGVAVAAGLAPAALGSDTGGSVRIPAAMNGVTGLKSARGLISLFGAIQLSSTLDSIGYLARTAEDAFLLTQASAGVDPKDPISQQGVHSVAIPLKNGPKPLAGRRIAMMPPSQYAVAVDADVAQTLDQTRQTLEALGATIIEAPIPFEFKQMVPRNGSITGPEAYAYHSRYIEDDSLPFGPSVHGRLMAGKAVSSTDYINALIEHRAVQKAWQAWMADFDGLLTPCSPFAAIPVAEANESNLALGSFTRPGNFLNAAGLTLPAGFTAGGMPIGVQILAEPGSEGRLTHIGATFQRETDWHARTPDLSAVGL
jgi:aspartyl-tRNA(Asn)/glutamyl-tRNA(Gln) amidotransferase subunit A